MLVAFLSDVHANIHGLRSGYQSAIELGARKLFIAGDLVGRGPNPNEVIDFIREKDIPSIRGNVERKLLSLRDDPHTPYSKAKLGWTAREMKKKSWKFIEDLPFDLNLELEGVSVHIVHGSPLSDKDYIYPSITARGLESKMNGGDPDILVCGHSHIPFEKKFPSLHVINCGSVGLSVDGDPNPSFALADISDSSVRSCGIVRFQYPFHRLLFDMDRMNVPKKDRMVFLQGIKYVTEEV